MPTSSDRSVRDATTSAGSAGHGCRRPTGAARRRHRRRAPTRWHRPRPRGGPPERRGPAGPQRGAGAARGGRDGRSPTAIANRRVRRRGRPTGGGRCCSGGHASTPFPARPADAATIRPSGAWSSDQHGVGKGDSPTAHWAPTHALKLAWVNSPRVASWPTAPDPGKGECLRLRVKVFRSRSARASGRWLPVVQVACGCCPERLRGLRPRPVRCATEQLVGRAIGGSLAMVLG